MTRMDQHFCKGSWWDWVWMGTGKSQFATVKVDQNLFNTPHITSPNNGLTYPITTHADCKSSNLVYQLQCKKCKAFYIGATGQMLSKRVNRHRSTCMVVNSDLPVPIHTQSHQLPFQECWSVHIIHKLPNATLTPSAANTKCIPTSFKIPPIPRYQHLIASLGLPHPYFPFHP